MTLANIITVIQYYTVYEMSNVWVEIWVIYGKKSVQNGTGGQVVVYPIVLYVIWTNS